MPIPKEIALLRQDIDGIDCHLASLLKRRMAISLEIQKMKADLGGKPIDQEREKQVIANYERFCPGSINVALTILQLCRGVLVCF